MILRIAEEKDISRIAEMEKICFPNDPWSYEMVREDIVENDRAFYFVYELDEKIVAYVGIWLILDEGHITNVAVDPMYRRKHIGETLISALVETTREVGTKAWTLEVRESNYPAIKLYEKMGFEKLGLRKGYYHDNGENAIIMWRRELDNSIG